MALALLCVSTALRAQSFVVESGQVVTASRFMGNSGDNGLVKKGGSIVVLGSHAIFTSLGAAGVTITNHGAITTTGSDANGVYALGDSATITNSGAITTGGAGVYGISATAASATVSNSGSITTAGGDAYGVYARSDNANISNSGSITTTGTGGIGVYTERANISLTNSGAISTTGANSHGVYADRNNTTIINTGTISTTGASGFGLYANGADTAITNRGAITTAGSAGHGMYAAAANATISSSGTISIAGPNGIGVYTRGADTSVTNSGTITNSGTAGVGDGIRTTGVNSTVINNGSIRTSGPNGHGIFSSDSNAAITNRGAITTTGTIGHGILAESDNAIITNSGLIQSGQANAVQGAALAAQTLNVQPGSRILGGIDLLGAGDGDTANVYGSYGSSVMTFANTETINVYTDNALRVGNAVVVDPTVASSRAVSLHALGTGVHSLLGQRLQRAPQPGTARVASLELSPGMLRLQREPVAWAQVLGSQMHRGSDGQRLAYNHHYAGVVAGYERDLNERRLGWVLGMARADTSSPMMGIKTHSVFGGAYARTRLGEVLLSGSLLAGMEDHDNRRVVLDNVNGYQTAASRNHSVFVSPSVSMSSVYVLTPLWELRPSVSLGYSVARYEGYAESGTTSANLVVGERNAQAWHTRLQFEGARMVAHGEAYVRAGLQARNTLDGEVQANLGGSDFRFATAGKSAATGSFVGAGTLMALEDRLELVADVEYAELSGDETELSAKLTLQYQFF